MTQELLDYSRGNISLQAQEVEVGRWLDRIIEYLWEDLDASNVGLITRFDHRGPVHIDADRLRRVVINIAGNAADAMPKGGRFTIISRVVGDSWELAVTDTGTGIPEQLRPGYLNPSSPRVNSMAPGWDWPSPAGLSVGTEATSR